MPLREKIPSPRESRENSIDPLLWSVLESLLGTLLVSRRPRLLSHTVNLIHSRVSDVLLPLFHLDYASRTLFSMVSMLPARKLSQVITRVRPSASYVHISNHSPNLYRVSKVKLQIYQNVRWVCESYFPSLSTPSNFQNSICGLGDKAGADLKASSTMAGTLLVQAKDPSRLTMGIEMALEECRLNDAWKFYQQHMQMEGFPRKSIVNKILVTFAQSLDVEWVEKAYGMVEQAFKEGKQNLLEKEPLIYLSLSLAKSNLPVPSSTILRRLVSIEQFPHVSAWSAILANMSRTAPGAYIAADLILEIGYLFQDNRVDPRKKSNAPLLSMKPNVTAFGIGLAGCLLFETTRKAEGLLDMMHRVGVKADTDLLMIIVQIYERNGQREELKKLQRHIDEAQDLNDFQFRQFYNSLFTCHLKFGDLDAASTMVLQMLRKGKEARNSVAASSLICGGVGYGKRLCTLGYEQCSRKESEGLENEMIERNSFLSYKDFSRDYNFSKLNAEAKDVLTTLLKKLHRPDDLLTIERGMLQPTEKAFVKLVKAFLEADKTKDLAEFLIKAQKEDSPVSNDNSPLVHVINSCISLGWLDQAHDLLDEMRLAGVRTGSLVYTSLLKAYCQANQEGKVTSLIRDARKAGIQLDSSCYDALIRSKLLQNDNAGALHFFQEMKESNIPRAGHQEFEKLVDSCSESIKSGFMEKLLQEIREGQRADYGVQDWNNVIHFFCKKRLMQDAENALKKMRSLGFSPNAQTFHSLVTGYAAIGGKYVEVTELWGEMKSIASATSMKFDQELLDSLLYTFVRGAFFVRANEIVGIMEKEKMFIDKYKYRTLFLKYHKTLYKGKASKVQTEAQLRKREAALAFKRWVGLY